jgi:hypothetical protein
MAFNMLGSRLVDKRTFVNAIRLAVEDGAVANTISALTKPPGRKPNEDILALSAWFRHLLFDDREKVERVIQQAAGAATFGFLCMLDGVTAIENGPPTGAFDLRYRRGTTEVRLNDHDGEMLHDLFKAR